MGTLRFLLALSVVIAHSSPLFGLEIARSVSAVQGFYIVSGFLVSMILYEKYPADTDGLRLFYSNRALRIFPTYWVALLMTLLLAPQIAIGYWKSQLPNLSWSTVIYLVWSNIGLFGIDSIVFVKLQNGALELTQYFGKSSPPAYVFLFVPQAWTLGIELAIYVIAPFLFRRSIVTLVTVAGVSFLMRAVAFHLGYRDDPWTYRFMPFELGLFILGSISYRAYRALRDSAVLKRLAPLAFLAMLVLSFGYTSLSQEPSWLAGFTNAQVIYLGAIAALLPALFVWSRTSAVDRRLGELSYPLYLCHLIVITWCAGAYGLGNWIPSVGSVLLAILITSIVESPINRLRQMRISSARIALANHRQFS